MSDTSIAPFEDNLSHEVWHTKFRDPAEVKVEEMWWRVANGLAAIEDIKERAKYAKEYFRILSVFNTMAGRILSNTGTDAAGTTPFNCFILGPRLKEHFKKKGVDSMEGIMEMLKEQAITLKSEGGYGTNLSHLRPRGAFIKGIKSESCGPIAFADIWNTVSDTITQGSGTKKDSRSKASIRKGAMMLVLECLAGDTPINTFEGKKSIRSLVGTRPYLYCTDEKGAVLIRQAEKVWKTGVRKTVKVTFDNDDFIECTPDQPFLLTTGKYKNAGDLQKGDSLAALDKRLYGNYLQLGIAGSRKTIAEHNAVYEMKFGEYPTSLGKKTRDGSQTIAHHVDENSTNNHPDNIESMTIADHSRHHARHIIAGGTRVAQSRKGKTWTQLYGKVKAAAISKKYRLARKGQPTWNKGLTCKEYKQHYETGFSNQFEEHRNHKVVSVVSCGTQEVFDIAMPDPYHNFCANGVFVHNCWHPSIMEFIKAKTVKGRLDKFNISVGITDEFMEAVDADTEFDLVFPDTEFPKYNAEWMGDIEDWKRKGYPIVTYQTVKAKDLYDTIMQSTYTRNDPGVLFLSRMNKMNNLWYCERIIGTNPSLRKGTRVLTKEGIFPIEELEGKDITVRNLDGQWSPAKCFLSGRSKQLWKITLSTGMSVYSTKEHRWPLQLVGGGFAKADTDQVKSGHMLPFDYQPSLDLVEKNNDQDHNLGFMIGWLYGDGWISNRTNKFQMGKTVYGFCFSEEEYYLADSVVSTVNELKSQASEVTKRDKMSYIQITSKEFDRYVKELGVGSKSNGIPASIWNRGEEYLKGFIDGIFSSDGSVSRDGVVSFCTKNKKMASDVQEILAFYGIKSYVTSSSARDVTFPNGKKYDKTYTRYDIRMTGYNAKLFAQAFSLSHQRKQALLKDILAKDASRTPNEVGLVKVVSVEKTDLFEDVWDITVHDDTHCFRIGAAVTGNCGEQPGPDGLVCDLGSLNLVNYVNADRTDWNYEALATDIPLHIRMLDSVNSIGKAPLDIQNESIRDKRRVGQGILGFGSAMMLLKVRYGSPKCVELTEKFAKFWVNTAYKASALLAKEKGPFPLYNKELYLQSQFLRCLDPDTIELIKKHGMRNSHVLSIAPTGNCQTMDTEIRTLDGFVSIKDIFDLCTKLKDEPVTLIEGTWIKLSNPLRIPTFEGNDVIERIYINGKQDIKIITLEGKEQKLKSTLNHRYLIKTNDEWADWIEAKDLKPGMKIISVD